MKKIIVLIVLLVSSFTIAQEKEEVEYPQDVDKKTELKINAFGLVAFEWLDVSYERLINEESSFGVGLLVGFDGDDNLDEYRKFSLTPFYRRYFSAKYARGFFVEGFGMLHSYEDRNYDYYYDNFGNYVNNSSGETNTEFAIGFSIGGKFVSKTGFSTEIYLGVGRNLGGDSNSAEAVGRGGISLGYRF